MTAQYRLLTLSDLMMKFRRSQSRRWGGAHRLFYPRGQIDDAARRLLHGFDGGGLWCRRRAAGHDADGTVVNALTEVDGDTIILKRLSLIHI